MSISTVALKGEIVETATNTATNWFTVNLVPNVAQQPGEMIKFIVQVHVNTTTVVNVLMDIGATEVVLGLNGAVAIVADSLHTESFMIPNTCTGINFQHATTNQDISIWVGETREFANVL